MGPWLTAFPELAALTIPQSPCASATGASGMPRGSTSGSAPTSRPTTLRRSCGRRSRLTSCPTARERSSSTSGAATTTPSSRASTRSIRSDTCERRSNGSASAERALVVSDDPDWCRANLDSLIRSRAGEVEYAAPDPLANFLAVARACRIIGTNSTFTLLGGLCRRSDPSRRRGRHAAVPCAHGPRHRRPPARSAVDGDRRLPLTAGHTQLSSPSSTNRAKSWLLRTNLLERADLVDPAVLQEDQRVGVAHGRQPVRDDRGS